MRSKTLTLIPLLLSAAMLPLGQLASAQSRTDAKASAKEPVPEEKLNMLRKQFAAAFSQVLYSGEKDCGDDDCQVDIAITKTMVGDDSYCIARIPNPIKFTTKAHDKRHRITWKLSATTLGGNTSVEFHQLRGILAVLDDDLQFIPKNRRKSAGEFEAINLHELKSDVTYVPVILWIDNSVSPPAPQVCATGDPKIENY